MTLDEAIKRYTDNAEYERTHGNLQGYLEFKRLEKWLKELKQLRKQEHCEDAVSRKTVLNTLNRMDSVLDENRTVETYKELLTACYKDLPSVTPAHKQKWIPVSEKLPEVNQRVLVTSYGRVCYAMMISADANSGYPVFKLQGSLNERVVCETTVHNEFTTSRIKAWMPLPDPYRADNRAEQGLAYADQDTMMPAT